MPTKAWQPLTAVLVVLGIPAAVGAVWRQLVARHPVAALALAAGWLVVCGAGVLARQALSGPARRRLEQAGNAADRAAGWWLSGYGRRYRQWVLDSRRYVDVKDLATGGDHTPELDDVYVDVALVRRAPHQVSGNPLLGVPEDAAGRHSLSEFVNRRKQVVLAVVGPAGSGKSTLLAHAARRSARDGHGGRRHVPVLLALREHAGTIVAAPDSSLPDVLRPTVSGVPGSEPDGWWERQLRRGKCIILLDGLDEVAREEDRRAVAAWVGRLISSYPGNHFVITSRPHGFPGPVIAQADVLAVRPFSAAQVQLFLNRWYLAVERHAAGATSKAQLRAVQIRASESAARLLTLLGANPALHDLTVNPLLLTMIATVHRYRGALPGSRADLYGEICQVMLSRRLQAKDLPELLPWPVKHKLLAALAYQMMLKRASELPVSQVLEILDPLLSRLQSVTGQRFLDDISRNGLLVEPAPGRYAFTHLTFQEYLAARHIAADPSLIETLTSAVDDPWWRETLLLYSATSDADQIVRACLDSATIPALALAFDCAEASSELAPELRQRLDQVHEQAFKKDCGPQHRRLIAAVLAARLASHAITTTAGARICDRPVSADLYWLFLQDTPSPEPDSPCEPRPDRPATGIWGSEALTFPKWLNTITAGFMQAQFRLPYNSELQEQAVTRTLAWHFPGSVTGAWTQPEHGGTALELWVPPGQPNPHLVNGDAILQAIVLDASNTDVLSQILSMTACGTTCDLARDLASDLDLHRDRDRARNLVSTLNLASTLDFTHIHALDLERARDLASDLYRVLNSASAFARDNPASVILPRELNSARTRARHLASTLADGFGFDLDPDPDSKVHFLGISEVPLRWVSSGPLGRIPRRVTRESTSFGDACHAFADALTSRAGIWGTTQIPVQLDGSLTGRLRHLRSPRPPGNRTSTLWDAATAADSLADAIAPLLNGHQHPDAPEAAGIRAVALALASENADEDNDTPNIFRTAAATVTLLQHRAQGAGKTGESIFLTLA